MLVSSSRPLSILRALVCACAVAVLLLASGSGVAAQTATVFAEGAGPSFLAMDGAGFVYTSALYDGVLLKLNASTLQVVARFSLPAGANYLYEPLGVAVVGTSLYAVDITNNHLVRFSTTNGSLIAVYDLTAYGIEYPIALAASPSGTSLYVTDGSPNAIHQLSLNGTLLQTFNTSAFIPNDFENVQTLTVDAITGNLFIGIYNVDPATYAFTTAQIFVLSPAGALIRVLNITQPNPQLPVIPEGLSIAANGTVLVLVDDDSGRVFKMTINGTILWNVSAAFGGYYAEPLATLIDPSLQYVLVSDVFNARIDKLDYNTGALLATYATSSTALLYPTSVAVFGSTVYVTSPNMGYVAVFAQNGSQTSTWLLSSTPNHSPEAIAVDASGFTYVADAGYSSVYKLSQTGVIVQQFNTSNPALSFYYPSSYNMAVASNGDLFLSDTNNARIVRFAANGTVIRTINVTIAGFSPAGLALLPNGQLVAADSGNSRVWIFAANGSVVTSFNLTTAWYPQGVAVGTSTANVTQIFVSDGETPQIVVFSTVGRVLRTLTATALPLLSPAGLALSTSGDLYVADSGSSRVLVFRNAVNAVSTVLGDPQFVGLRGQSFQVHGIDGAVYALVSSPSTQVNARFVFLSSGRCPSATLIDTQCWSHAGSYLGAVSVQERVAGHGVQRLLVESGAHDVGFASIELNGRVLSVGDSVSVGHFSVHVQSSHRIAVRTAALQLTLDNSDSFINQQVEALIELTSMAATRTHGLLGQTHSAATHKSALRYVEGDVDEYVVSGLFEHDFAYDHFTAEK